MSVYKTNPTIYVVITLNISSCNIYLFVMAWWQSPYTYFCLGLAHLEVNNILGSC